MTKKKTTSDDFQDMKEGRSSNGELRALAARYDKFHMAAVIERTPGQIEFALTDSNFPEIQKREYSLVIVAGMGGSALPIDVLKGAFHGRFCTPIDVCRNYRCLSRVSPMTLAVASSFSGNTEEAITAMEDIAGRGAEMVVIAAGGRLEEIAHERGYPLVRIPYEREGEGFQPRSATGYMVTYFARMFSAAGILEDPTSELSTLPSFLRSLNIRSQAEEMARWFADRIPVIYVDEPHESSIARIFKIKLNENAKRPAFYYSLPEANHNEMIGFTQPYGRFAVLYLCDPASHERVNQRFDIMKKLFQQRGLDHVDFRQWTLPGDTALRKIFAGLLFADWCAYTLALLGGIDPSPVSFVEEFKVELNND